MMSAPTSQTVAVFRYSIARPLGWIAGAIVLMAACLAIALSLTADGVAPLAAYAAAAASGLAAIIMMVRAARRGPVLDVTTAGLRDRRLSPDLVQWMDIARASVQQAGGQRMLALQLHPQAQARLRRAPGTGSGNWSSLSIAMAGLNGSIDDLIGAIKRAAEITIATDRS